VKTHPIPFTNFNAQYIESSSFKPYAQPKPMAGLAIYKHILHPWPHPPSDTSMEEEVTSPIKVSALCNLPPLKNDPP
jgi:hypothetical protein